MTIKIEQIPVGRMANFSYIIYDPEILESIVVDPSWDLEKIFDFVKKNQLSVKYVLNTHTHFDHILGNDQVSLMTGAKVIQHKNSGEPHDLSVNNGDLITLGKSKIRVIFTPGHSPDSICLVVDEKYLLTGDTLFVGNCGRTDLPGSNPEQMYESLFHTIAKMDESLIIYPGHNYGHVPVSTIGDEKKNNYILQERTKDEFLEFMGISD